MSSITFRFATECEMTIKGKSYEDAYMKFKDFMHGDDSVQKDATVTVCPPESDQLYFSLDQQYKMYEIEQFKGSFAADIEARDQKVALTPADVGINHMWSGAVSKQLRTAHNPG